MTDTEKNVHVVVLQVNLLTHIIFICSYPKQTQSIPWFRTKSKMKKNGTRDLQGSHGLLLWFAVTILCTVAAEVNTTSLGVCQDFSIIQDLMPRFRLFCCNPLRHSFLEVATNGLSQLQSLWFSFLEITHNIEFRFRRQGSSLLLPQAALYCATILTTETFHQQRDSK